MARVRDALQRFRPAGAPGAAGAAGVPTDHGAELAAELVPVFAQLADTERDCTRILERAVQTAAEVRARDAERARSIVAAAGERVDAERAAAVAQMRQRAEAQSAAALDAAEQSVAELRRCAGERMPSFVDLVVASVGRLIEDGQRSDEQQPGAR